MKHLRTPVLFPFIHRYGTDKWSLTLLSGLFVFVVLYVYRGYNIEQSLSLSGHSLLSRTLLHALATSFVYYVCEFHVKGKLTINSSLKKIVWSLGEMLIGTHVTFFLFNYFWQWTEMKWVSYAMFLYEYPLIVIFPTVLSYLLVRYDHRPAADTESILLVSDNAKSKFDVKVSNLLYVKSAGNYVEVFYRSADKIKTVLLRRKLSDIEKEYSSYLVRCHRSYVINPSNIEQIISSGRTIKLEMFGAQIPVSKGYAANIMQDNPNAE